MTSTPEELAYAESVRALEQQARALDELRSRAGILIGAASIVSSVLGASALNRGTLTTYGALGLLCLAVVLGLCGWVLWPQGDWRWIARPSRVLWWAHPSVDRQHSAMHAYLALVMEQSWDANRKRPGSRSGTAPDGMEAAGP
jgi:hypothetical protein